MHELKPSVPPLDSRAGTFAEFVADVEPRLRRTLAVAYGIEAGAEATAEALAYAWENWERVAEMENPSGYLYKVARSRARRRKTPRPTFPAVPADQAPWIEPGLPEALGRLTRHQRTAVWLIHGFEWTLEETAGALGISVSSVRTHLARGERKLRSALGVTR